MVEAMDLQRMRNTEEHETGGHAPEEGENESMTPSPSSENDPQEIHDTLELLTITLNLLSLELPDPEQRIAEQELGQALENFTGFPRLPCEIRLMIWKQTLPGRRVVALLPRWTPQQDQISTLPITLYINSESRSFTKRHYGVFFQRDQVFFKGWFRRVFAIDPSVDLLCVNWRSLRMSRNLPDIYSQGPASFDKVRCIEIEQIYSSGMAWGVSDNSFHFLNNRQRMDMWLYRTFKGLQQVHFVSPKDGSFNGPEVKEYCEMISKTRDGESDSKSKKDSLEIILHDFRRRQIRSDYDHLHEAAVPYPWNGKLPSILESENLHQDKS
ncbi:hypothetical protein ACEPPN_012400 [Leptodophora sp. 'Broadleaf-Isolate-01']